MSRQIPTLVLVVGLSLLLAATVASAAPLTWSFQIIPEGLAIGPGNTVDVNPGDLVTFDMVFQELGTQPVTIAFVTNTLGGATNQLVPIGPFSMLFNDLTPGMEFTIDPFVGPVILPYGQIQISNTAAIGADIAIAAEADLCATLSDNCPVEFPSNIGQVPQDFTLSSLDIHITQAGPAVPGPATGVLVSVGLMGLYFLRRRRE